jgi:hypothetical protein
VDAARIANDLLPGLKEIQWINYPELGSMTTLHWESITATEIVA